MAWLVRLQQIATDQSLCTLDHSRQRRGGAGTLSLDITELDTTPSLQLHDEDTGDGGDAAAAGHLLPHLLSIFSIFRGGVDQ